LKEDAIETGYATTKHDFIFTVINQKFNARSQRKLYMNRIYRSALSLGSFMSDAEGGQRNNRRLEEGTMGTDGGDKTLILINPMMN